MPTHSSGGRDSQSTSRGILAHEVAQVGEHLAGAVAALNGTLVHILAQGVVGGAEEAAVDHIHVGIVAGIAQGVATVLTFGRVCSRSG